MHIQPHSRCAIRGIRKTYPALFENRKKCPNFGKKGPNCVHLSVKFSIQNVVLRVSRRKNSKIFPWGSLFSCAFDEMFIKVPYFHHLSPPSCCKKFLAAHLYSGIMQSTPS